MILPSLDELLSIINNSMTYANGGEVDYYKLNDKLGVKVLARPDWHDSDYMKRVFKIQEHFHKLGIAPPCWNFNAEHNLYVTANARVFAREDDLFIQEHISSSWCKASTVSQYKAFKREYNYDGFIQRIYDDYGLHFGDSCSFNWGVYNGKPVIIDLGEFAECKMDWEKYMTIKPARRKVLV